ncbi:MAG: hypothetical protein ACYTX0_50795, partial [Nostoc sp.]
GKSRLTFSAHHLVYQGSEWILYQSFWTGNCVAERRRLSPRLLGAIAYGGRLRHRTLGKIS